MYVTEEHLRLYREEGYCVIRDFFTQREVAAMRAELARLVHDALLRNVRTEGDGKTHSEHLVNLQICPITPKSTFYRALPFHPKIVETVGRLIGNPFVFYLDQIFLKPAKIGTGTSWHQDNAYFQIGEPLRGIGMWIALHEATVANGTMHIVPGSFREKYPHERDPHSDHHICCKAPEDRAIPVELPAGGALFFSFGVAHSTRDNKSQRDRAGLALHFLNVDYIPASVWERKGTYKGFAYLCGPAATGGQVEYGIRVAGTWEAEVDRMLASEFADGQAAAHS